MPLGGAIVRDLQTLKVMREVKVACCFYALDWNVEIIIADRDSQQCQLFDCLLLTKQEQDSKQGSACDFQMLG